MQRTVGSASNRKESGAATCRGLDPFQFRSCIGLVKHDTTMPHRLSDQLQALIHLGVEVRCRARAPGCDVFPWGFCTAATEKKAVALQCPAGCRFRKRSLGRKPCSWSVQGSFRPSPWCVPCAPSRENRRMLDRHMLTATKDPLGLCRILLERGCCLQVQSPCLPAMSPVSR